MSLPATDVHWAPAGQWARGGRVALGVAAAAMVVVVLLPCIVTFTTQLHFDVDPRMRTPQVPDIRVGPTGFAWLAVAQVAAGAGAIAASGLAGGKVRWGSAALAGLGMAAAGWQMTTAAENRLLGGAWIAAAAVGLGAAHLGRHALGRRVMIAGLVAALIPMTLDAVWYVNVDQPAAVKQFDRFATDNGWAKDSTQYELRKRRATSPGAVGAFGLANILGSVAATLTVLAGGMAVGLALTGRGISRWKVRRRSLLAGALAVVGGVAVALTYSKGALLAMPIGAAAFGVAVWARWGALPGREEKSARPASRAAPAAGLKKRGWWVGAVGVALVMMVVAGVLGVGAMGGAKDSVPGEGAASGPRVSLLFRAQYWHAAGRITEAQPMSRWLAGVGPRGFREGYLWAKDPTQPEAVKSAHNVFVDYGVMLGLGGVAWGALLLMWLWQGGCAAGGAATALRAGPAAGLRERQGGEGGVDRRMLGVAAAIAAVVFGVQWIVEIRNLDIDPAMVWLAGAVGYLFAAGALAGRAWEARPWTAAAAFAAAVTVLTHNQVSMAFYQPGSAALGWCVVGLAAAGWQRGAGDGDEAPSPGHKRAWPALIPAGVLAMAGVGLAVGEAWPTTVHENDLARASVALQHGQRGEALGELRAANAALPGRWDVLRWRVRLEVERANEAVVTAGPRRAEAVLADAVKLIDAYATRWGESARTHRLRAEVYERWGGWLKQSKKFEASALELKAAIRLAPYSMADVKRLWALSRMMGRDNRAVQMAKRLLKLDADNRLDPARQLTPPQREAVQAYLREHEPGRPRGTGARSGR